jgi:hypothetical protein
VSSRCLAAAGIKTSRPTWSPPFVPDVFARDIKSVSLATDGAQLASQFRLLVLVRWEISGELRDFWLQLNGSRPWLGIRCIYERCSRPVSPSKIHVRQAQDERNSA